MSELIKKTFTATEEVVPDEIINEQCTLLEKLTDGEIVAKVTEYTGPITTYTKGNPLSAFQDMFDEETVNIQEDLGDVSECDFTFEFFISSMSSPNYKYRILFLHYEIPFYPALIVLDEDIAVELGLEQRISCSNQTHFEKVIGNILNSQKVENVIGSLLAIAQKNARPTFKGVKQ